MTHEAQPAVDLPFPAEAADPHCLRYGALVVEMYDHPAAADRDMYSADLVHASARGHAVIAAATVRALAWRIPAEEFSTGAG